MRLLSVDVRMDDDNGGVVSSAGNAAAVSSIRDTIMMRARQAFSGLKASYARYVCVYLYLHVLSNCSRLNLSNGCVLGCGSCVHPAQTIHLSHC